MTRRPSGPPAGRRGRPISDRNLAHRAEGASLGGEQVEGRHAVFELLHAGRRRVDEVLVQDGGELGDLVDLARRRGVPVRGVAREEFARRARSEVHQGVLARAAPLEPVEIDALVRGVPAPFLVVLDGVTDPHNLGAVLRSALGAGATGVVLPRHRSAHVTPAAAKAAAGAIEHLQFALVGGVPNALERLRREGVWSIGLAADGESSLDDVRVLTEPLALVLGAEGAGLSSLARERCDLTCRIDLVGPLESLNVSAAAAVACFAVSRARRV